MLQSLKNCSWRCGARAPRVQKKAMNRLRTIIPGTAATARIRGIPLLHPLVLCILVSSSIRSESMQRDLWDAINMIPKNWQSTSSTLFARIPIVFPKSPKIDKPEQKENESDEESAQKAWELHLKRDDSMVIENFMGQIKSKVECPKETCGRVSTTFEPVMCLSKPLPGTTEITIVVTFVSMVPGEGMKKLNVTLSKTASVLELSRKIAMLVNDSKLSSGVVVAEDIVIAETWNKEIYKFYNGTEEVAKINDSDEIFAYQVATLEAIHQEQELEKDQEIGAEMQDEKHGTVPSID